MTVIAQGFLVIFIVINALLIDGTLKNHKEYESNLKAGIVNTENVRIKDVQQ